MSGFDPDDLIQREIDGVNDPSESARLKSLLEGDAELALRFRQLWNVSGSLERAERLEPPPGLADAVMAEVRRRAPRRAERPSWLEALRGLLAPVPLAACAASLVAGVALSVLLLPRHGGLSPSDTAAFSGTALPKSRLAEAGRATRWTFERDGVKGEALLRTEGGLVVVTLGLDAAVPTDLALDLEGALSVRAVSREEGPAAEVASSGRTVRIASPAGRSRHVVTLDGGGAPAPPALRLRVASGAGEPTIVALGAGAGR